MRAARTGVRRIAVAGGEIEFEVSGAAQRLTAPIVLLHGWALDRRMWAPQVHALSTDRTVIALDRRGYGWSSAPPYLAGEAEDVLAVLDCAGIEKAVIVGMSQAGRVAADLALRHPSRIAGLVLQGARLGSVAAAAAPDIPVADYAALVREGRIDAVKAQWRDHPLMKLVDPRHQPIVDRMLEVYSGADLMIDRPPASDPGDEALAAVRAPALVLTGEFDSALRRQVADHLAATIPDAERAEIGRAGHLCNLCAAATYNATLQRFLDRVSARTS